jgi:hypothetical protein
MSLTLQVHTYEDDQASGERRLVAYHPFMLVGRPLDSGHAGERLYLQAGCVYGEGGHVVPPDTYPDWLVEVLDALNPDELRKVGFVPQAVEEEAWPSHQGEAPPPAYPPGFKPDRWILGWLCKNGHDYQQTGHSRYDKSMRCVDCTNVQRTASKHKRKEASRGAP